VREHIMVEGECVRGDYSPHDNQGGNREREERKR
jgi:hypothetical protein